MTQKQLMDKLPVGKGGWGDQKHKQACMMAGQKHTFKFCAALKITNKHSNSMEL
jgi:hypothetical protein